MKKKILLFVLCAVLLSSTAFAGYWPGQWTSNPTYYISSTNPYYTALTSSVGVWNNTLSSISANIRINSTTATSANVTILTEYYGDIGWNAATLRGPVSGSGTWTYGQISINRSMMDSHTLGQNKATCLHEVGHLLGLSHNTYTSPRTVMYEGGSSIFYLQWGISTPQTNDISDLNSIY